MQYLNRVHFDAPMSPLELEIYHQMRNVIGIDPAFYEYIFTVDADTVRSLSISRGITTDEIMICPVRHSGLSEPFGCVSRRRLEHHRYLRRDQAGQPGGVLVDDDSGTNIPDERGLV